MADELALGLAVDDGEEVHGVRAPIKVEPSTLPFIAGWLAGGMDRKLGLGPTWTSLVYADMCKGRLSMEYIYRLERSIKRRWPDETKPPSIEDVIRPRVPQLQGLRPVVSKSMLPPVRLSSGRCHPSARLPGIFEPPAGQEAQLPGIFDSAAGGGTKTT